MNGINKEKIGKRLGLSIYGKNYTFHIFKDVIRALNTPKYLCLKTKDLNSIAIMPTKTEENMSFRVPENLLEDKSKQFVITSKPFVENVFNANNLDLQKSYRMVGYHLEKENAVIFDVKTAKLIKCENNMENENILN